MLSVSMHSREYTKCVCYMVNQYTADQLKQVVDTVFTLVPRPHPLKSSDLVSTVRAYGNKLLNVPKRVRKIISKQH